MKHALIILTALALLSQTAYSQQPLTASQQQDLRNKTALKVIETMYYQDTLLANQYEISARKDSIITMQKTLIDSCEQVSHNAYMNARKMFNELKSERKQVRIWQSITALTLILTLIL